MAQNPDPTIQAFMKTIFIGFENVQKFNPTDGPNYGRTDRPTNKQKGAL